MEEIRFDPIERKEFFLAKLGGQEITPPDAVTRIEHYLQDIIDGNASTIPPITRMEYYLAKISGADVAVPDPVTRTEYYLAKIAGMDVEPPDPITRLDYFLAQWVETGGGVLETVTGNAPITLADALAKDIVSLTQYGFCDQADTPTPSSPVDIKCNNGTLTAVDDELPTGYKRVLGFTCNNNAMWAIANFHLKGSDTVRIGFSVKGACNVFGCYQGTDATDNYDLYVSTTSGAKYLRYGNGTYPSYWSDANISQRFDVVFGPTGTQGMPDDSTWTESSFTAANELVIGSVATTGTSSKLKGNLYGNIVVDGRLKLIPCERVSDGVLGYYDTYSETFYEPSTGFAGAVSLGYDGSHYQLQVVGTSEVLTVSASGAADQTASVADLLSVGDSKDEHEIIHGVVKRKVGTYVFDGSETFGSSSAYGTALYINAFAARIGADRSVSPLCTHFVGGEASGQQPEGTVFFNASGHCYFRTTDSASDFKAFLKGQYDAGTPVILVFALATGSQTTESFAEQPLTASEGTNTISATAEVSTIALKAKYKKSAA